jgi:hypothetical protein
MLVNYVPYKHFCRTLYRKKSILFTYKMTNLIFLVHLFLVSCYFRIKMQQLTKNEQTEIM